MVKLASWLNFNVRKQVLDEIKEQLFKTEFDKAIKESYKSPKKNKRSRSAFTTEQIQFLENEFKKNPYLEKERRKAISEIIKIAERAIKIWFQNRRMKEKARHQEQELIGHQEFNDDQRFVRKYGNELINVFDLPSVNDRSLPNLNSSEESVSMLIDVNNRDETVYRNQSIAEANRVEFYKDNSVSSSSNQDQLIITRVPSYQVSETRSRSSSPFLSAEYSIELMKKYSRERNHDVVEHMNQTRDKHVYPQASSSSQDDEFMLPQDLSVTKKKSPIVVPYEDRHGVSSSLDSPHSSSDSARPYNHNRPFMRPDNVFWRPIQVLGSEAQPMIAHSSKVFPSSSSSEQNCRSVSCRCECHIKGCPSTPILYEIPNSRVHYVLSAEVPMQGLGAPYDSN